jgi:AAA ATPase-like protein
MRPRRWPCCSSGCRGEGGALVVRGGAGVGKTTLLDWALEQAHGFRALEASGAEFEMELAFAGLHVLCGPLLGGCDRLPEPQREALEAAFGFRTGSAPDPLRAGMAVLTPSPDAGEDAPVICVVDDAQWLDRASAQALAFAARRIGSEPVAMLFGVRDPDVPSELGAIPALRVEGLPDGDARELLQSVLRSPLDERVVDRIVAEARGNPLALRELAAAGTPGELVGGFAVSGAGRGDGGELFRPRLRTRGCCSCWPRPSPSGIPSCCGAPPSASASGRPRPSRPRPPDCSRSARGSASTTRSCARRSTVRRHPRPGGRCARRSPQ